MRNGIGWMVVAAVVLAACGAEDEAAGPARSGTVIRGVMDGEPAEVPGRPHVGLIYVAFGDPEVPYFGDAAPARGEGLPARFEFELKDAPHRDALASWWNEDGSEDGRVALAFVYGFDDVDGNGTWVEDDEGGIAPDRLVGVSIDTMLLYVERSPVEGGFAATHVLENPEAATPGFHLVRPVCPEDGAEGGRLRILDAGSEVEVIVPEDEQEIELPCLDFVWPSSEPLEF